MASKSDGRWHKLYTRVWSDEKFSALSAPSPCGQWLWFYFVAGPRTTLLPGLCSVSESTIAEDLHWSLKAVQSALDEITAMGMAKFDRRHRLLFVPKAIEYNPPANPNIVRGWRRFWDDLPECDLKREAFDVLRAHVSERSESLVEAFDSVIERPSPPPISNGSANGLENGSTNGSPNGYRNQIEGRYRSKNKTHVDFETVDETVIETVRQVFAHWQAVMNSPRSKLDAKRTRQIAAALKLGYSADDLKRAIDGCKASPFHMGENDAGRAYNALDLILRNAEKIDQFIGFAASPPKPHANGNGAHDPDWFRSDQGIERKARELGIGARAGESYAMLRERVQRALDDRNSPRAS